MGLQGLLRKRNGGTDRRTNRQLDGYRIIRGDAIPPPQLRRKGDKNVVK